MRTLSISISDSEFAKLGLQDEKLSYNDWLDLFARQNLIKAIELGEKYGLSAMTMDEITKEVRAVRDNAKDNS